MSVKLAENGSTATASLQQTKSGPVVETSADAFDKDDFDPLRYINEMFPSGEHATCTKSICAVALAKAFPHSLKMTVTLPAVMCARKHHHC